MSKKNEMGLTQYPYHNVNPFLDGIVEQIVPTKYTRKKAAWRWQDVLNPDTGELEKQHMMVLGTRKEVDKREFVKIYKGQLKEFYGLSKSSFILVDYIIDTIRYSDDRIFLLVSDIMGQTGLGYTTVYRSITQLIEKKLLAKADRTGSYFINPQIFFKGDTITLINQFVKVEKKSIPIKKQLK